MEQNRTAISENAKDDIAAKNRFDAFKLGKGWPSTVHKHSRSHSRNASVTSMSALILPSSKSASINDFSNVLVPHGGNATGNAANAPSRNSHHRRRSSVSTRHESAEMMGVTLPDLPQSTSDDNVNFGEKDSIRRRALWALEGKPEVGFQKVEIPELGTPDIDKSMFDFSTKPSFPAGSGAMYGSALVNKRDSFKLLGTAGSTKDLLHTLVEEEEEEEEEEANSLAKAQGSLPTPVSPVQVTSQESEIEPISTPSMGLSKNVLPRTRPANLHLRPLSLTPESLAATVSGLPTPSPTPSPSIGLRSLSLSPSPPRDSQHTDVTPPSQSRRRSTMSNDSCESLNLSMTSIDDEPRPKRRSSISYKSSGQVISAPFAVLPTPEMTPTFQDGRHGSARGSSSGSITGTEGCFFADPPTHARPLSTSEQHFLFKSHNALLSRITDLERALSMRRRTSGGYSIHGYARPMSIASDFSSSSDTSGEPSDEMLRLLADLKAERDELKKDVDGWRSRVVNLEKQANIMAKRVDAERRDAWVARSRAGLLEVEKGALEKRSQELEGSVRELVSQKQRLEDAVKEANKAKDTMALRIATLEKELQTTLLDLESERNRRKHGEESDTDLLVTPTPRTEDSGIARRREMVFTSLDSESSTDVEADSAFNDSLQFPYELKVVEEVSEEDQEEKMLVEEEDNGLAHYEDEQDSDLSFRSSSSYDSVDEYQRATSLIQIDVPTTSTSFTECGSSPIQSRSVSPVLACGDRQQTTAQDGCRATLSMTWTFPKGTQVSSDSKQVDEEDRFFGCLDDAESGGGETLSMNHSAYNYENSKKLFASGFIYDSIDDDVPFFVPGDIGILADRDRLSDVAEEEEEEYNEAEDDSGMIGEAGEIKITFTPALEEDSNATSVDDQVKASPVKKAECTPVPAVSDICEQDHEYDGESVSIPSNFGRSSVSAEAPVTAMTDSCQVIASSAVSVPPKRSSAPSSIPRASSMIKPLIPTSIIVTPPSPKPARIADLFTATHSTPSNKGTASFIPQPVSSPSPIRAASRKSNVDSAPTFIRPPQRKLFQPAGNAQPLHGVANDNSDLADHVLSKPFGDGTPLLHSTSAKMTNDHLSHHSHDTCSAPFSRTHEQTHHLEHTFNASLSAISSSISSMMSAPLSSSLSLQTFTHYIPRPWSGRRNSVSAICASDCGTPSVPPASFGSDTHTARPVEARVELWPVAGMEPAEDVPRKHGFVSREKQLRILRTRLIKEGFLTMHEYGDVHCRSCTGELVLL